MELPQLAIHASAGPAKLLNDISTEYDGTVIFFADKKSLEPIFPCVKAHLAADAAFGDALQLVVPESKVPSERVLLAPLGSINSDFDDVRRFKGKQWHTA